jgi:hypothetical protein
MTQVPAFYTQCFEEFPSHEFIVDRERRFTYAQVQTHTVMVLESDGYCVREQQL